MSFFTELTVLSFEKIAFAQSLSVPNYRYELNNFGYGVYGQAPENGGILEIGFVEQNPLLLSGDDGEHIVDENCIFIIPPESRFSVRSTKDGIHRHTTSEFLIRFKKKNVEGTSSCEGKKLVLPLIIPPSQGSGEVFSVIRSIVCSRITKAERGYFEECADFMLLISRICSILSESHDVSDISPGNRRYCERAKEFISENIDKRISVGDVAKAVGVSKNYLTNLFSGGEGITLIEYINRCKLSYMLELIRRYGFTISQAGEYIGISDANYLSRIFKRYYGYTISEYKRDHMK